MSKHSVPEKQIDSIESLIIEIRTDYSEWQTSTFPWFRGEPDVKEPLLPRLYRKTEDCRTHDENQLVQFFRIKAPTLGFGLTPDREHTDEWLFLMRHVGLPTRLLDWTEGALIALYFALLEKKPIVWMLDPVQLNRLSTDEGINDNRFPLTWVVPKDSSVNIGSENFRGAWERDRRGTEFPVAVHPTNIHPRMSAQRSCFTIQGKRKDPLSNLVDSRILRRYVINAKEAPAMKQELRVLGISHSSLFPDLEGLAKDLESIY